MDKSSSDPQQGAGPMSQTILIVDQNFKKEIQQLLKSHFTMNQYEELVNLARSEDITSKHKGIIGIRKLVSVDLNPPIQQVIDSGLIPQLIQLLKQTDYPQLQLQSAWILTNVASGTTDQCKIVVDKGAIPLFLNCLKSQSQGLLEQAVWAIGNISADNTQYRDNIINQGGIISLIDIFSKASNQNLIKNCCWALSSLCRGKPLPKHKTVFPAIIVLCKLIKQGKVSDQETLSDCLWAISYHSEEKKQIKSIIETQSVPLFVKFLDQEPVQLLTPALRIVGNIATGSNEQAEILFSNNILSRLEKLLSHPKKIIRKEVCWVLSNLAAGSKAQVTKIMECDSLMKKVIELFQTDTFQIRRQICHIFANICGFGDVSLSLNLFKDNQLLKFYIDLFVFDDVKAKISALDCLSQILSQGEMHKAAAAENPYLVEFEKVGGVQALEDLQTDPNAEVYEKAVKLIETYFT